MAEITEPTKFSDMYHTPMIHVPWAKRPFEWVRRFVRWIGLCWSGTKVADMMGVPKHVQDAYLQLKHAPSSGGFIGGYDYQPDSVVESFKKPIMNPVVAFHEALVADGDASRCRPENPFRGQKLSVREAWIFEGQVDEAGVLLRDPKVREAIGSKWPVPQRVRHVRSNEEYRALYAKATEVHRHQPERSKMARDNACLRESAIRKLKEDGFLDFDFMTDGSNAAFDPNQYTEFAPLMGGPFYRQLYMYDFLRQVAYAFEAQNHNPVAKAITRILVQYAFGRRFEMRIDDDQKKYVWEECESRYGITRKVCEFWAKESETYGDFILDTDTWESVDPSTIWDIITNPEHVSDEYYYYQSYPTAYQMFTGYTVPGEPGAEKQAASEYIIRQIPASKLLHMKLNCMSNEKRGRSSYFSILGWLKRIKDLYNAQVIREWLYSCFMWDVTVKGSAGDVNAYVSQNSQIPLPGSRHVHNEAVTMTPMPAIATRGGARGGSVGEELMCFIAVACGIPKEFLNVVSSGGGGSRAQALTSAEPFTKMIEDIQARWETFITSIFRVVIEKAGLKYKEGDVEILFPSVTKDTTSETMKNLQVAETMGWLAKRTTAEMAAKELNITQYDFEEEQNKIRQDKSDGFDLTGQPMIPAGRTGEDDPENDGGIGDSPIHGKGKEDLEDDLTSL